MIHSSNGGKNDFDPHSVLIILFAFALFAGSSCFNTDRWKLSFRAPSLFTRELCVMRGMRAGCGMRAMGDLLPQPHPPHRTRSLAPREYSAHLFFSRVFCASGYLLSPCYSPDTEDDAAAYFDFDAGRFVRILLIFYSASAPLKP